MEIKSCDLENKSFELNTNFESFMMNSQIQNRTISGMRDRIDEIEETLEKSGGTRFAKTQSDDENKNGSGESLQEIQNIIERLNGNDKLIDGLISKVQKVNSKLSKNKASTPQFSNSSGPSENKMDVRIKNMEKEIEDLKCSVPANTAASNDGTNHSSISHNLKKKLDSFNQDLAETKNAVLTCQQMLEEKPDFDQLQEIDKVVTDKLNDCIKAVRRQMLEKNESARSLKKLEKQLRSLYEVLYSQIGVSDSEDDPLLGKKTISAYSRSPYSKDMNAKTHLLKYPMWKKPPKSRRIRMRSHGKDPSNIMSNTGDVKTFKYYNMEPVHTQPDY